MITLKFNFSRMLAISFASFLGFFKLLTDLYFEFPTTLGGAKIIYRDVVCRLEDGTVAGSVLHLNRGVWNVYENSNIPLYECVNCASLNPATVIGVADKKGSLEVGKDADIIITDDKFEIKKTIISGEAIYEA